MISYANPDFDKISAVLCARAEELGASAFMLNGEVIELDVALDQAGPLTWAFTIHADSIARLVGLSTADNNALPFTMATSPDAEFGNIAVIKPGTIALGVAMNFLDAPLEHCICVGMSDMGYSPSEWLELPYANRVIPIEPYLDDLKNHWVSDDIESNDRARIAMNYPKLQTHQSLESLALAQLGKPQSAAPQPEVSRVVSFGQSPR